MVKRALPQRMCVGCRKMKNKRELLRVVRTPEGQVLIDDTGKMAGRGAYLCREITCLKTALKSHSLERGLKVKISEEVEKQLTEKINMLTFPAKESDKNSACE